MIFQQNSFQKPIFFDNDGGIDDLITLIVLLTLNQYRLTGVSVTDGVSPIEKSTKAISKIFSLFCRYDLQVAKSAAKPMNQFPEMWRNSIDLLLNHEIIQQQQMIEYQISEQGAPEFMASKILKEPQNTTIVATGPATNLQQFITKYPEVLAKIERIIWMAGTIHSNGNVVENGVLQKKEWNIYWDAASANQLLQSGIPILLIPIDTVKQATVSEKLLNKLSQLDSTLGKIISSIFKEMTNQHSNYYFWDVLTTAGLLNDQIFTKLTEISVEIIYKGNQYGKFYEIENGSKISYPNFLDVELFIENFLSSLKQF